MIFTNKMGLFETIQENQQDLTQDVELIEHYKKVRLYPFRIVSGVQLITKSGETPITTNINVESQYANFYTGNNQITVVWEGSTTLTANHDTSNPNAITEQFTVGRGIDLLPCDEGLLNKANNLTTINLYGTDYTTTETQNTLSLFCNCDSLNIENKQGSFISSDEFNKHISNSFVPTDYDIQNYVYLILDPRYQSFQGLRIKNVVPYYNNQTRQPISAIIEFETINNDFINTGKSILQYFQFGVASESYAFPLESYDENGNIITTLDPSKIQTKDNQIEGINSLQIDHLCGYALSSVGIFGRVVEKQTPFIQDENGNYTRNIRPPQLLLLKDSLRVVESPFINRLPIQNVYVAYNMINDVNGVYNSYKDAFSVNQGSLGGYNVTASKQIVTGMRPSKNNNGDKVKQTNAVNQNQTDNTDYHNYTTGTTDGMNTPNWIQPIDQSNYVFGVPSFTASKNPTRQINIADFLNQNHVINGSIEELTTNYTESTKYTVSETLGLIGKIFTKRLSGLDFGWISAKTLATGQTYNVLLPCPILNAGEAINALNADHKTNALPLDYFTDDKASKTLPVDSNYYTAYRFSLTHLFSTQEYSEDDVNGIDPNNKSLNVGMGFNGIGDTQYIGQTTDENGRLLLTKQDGKVRALNVDIYNIIPIASTESYLVDWLSIKGIGQCDRRVSMYKHPPTQPNNAKSVYQLIAQTKSKVKQNITLGADSGLFNYFDEFNTFGSVEGPINPPAPLPPSTNTSDNQIIKVNPSIMYDAQTLTTSGYKTFSQNLQKAFKVDSSGLLFKQDSDTQQIYNNELSFQNLSNIANLNVTITQNATQANPTQQSNFNYIQTYNINSFSVVYNKDDGTQNNTFANLSNLDSLTLTVGLNNLLDNQCLNSNFSVDVTLNRTEAQNGTLDQLLQSSTVTVPFTLNVNNVNNTQPTPFYYPFILGGDFVSNNAYTYFYKQSIGHGQTVIKNDGFTLKHRWNYITNPLNFFNSDTYLKTVNNNNLLVDFNSSLNFSNGITKLLEDVAPLPDNPDLNGNLSQPFQFTNFNINSQSLNVYINQAFNYVKSSDDKYKLYQNAKPSFNVTNSNLTLTGNITLRLDLIRQTLNVAFTDLLLTTNINATYTLDDVLKSFNCNVKPLTNNYNDPQTGRVNPTINGTVDVYYSSSGFNNIENYHQSYNLGSNFTANAYAYTEFNGNNFNATVGNNRQATLMLQQKQSRLSPTFFFDDTASVNFGSGMSLNPQQIGNYNDNNQGIQQINQLAKTQNAPALVYQQNSNNIYNISAPFTLGALKSSALDGVQKSQFNQGMQYNNQSYDIQYDPTLNFQPLIFLNMSGQGKN